MLLETSIRLPSEPLEAVEAIRLRPDSPEQRPQEFTRVLAAARQASISDQAAFVHFGSRALGLARSQPPAADASLAEPDDTEGPEPSPGDAFPVSGAAASSQTANTDESSAEAAEDQNQVDEMKRRDRDVRTHEQAHKAAGGSYAGSVQLTYQMGPDGKRYAVEGAVPIDVSPVAGDPAATLRKMEVVARASRAPASPSGADQAVAAQAARVMQQARAQLAAERYARTHDLVRRG
jgi:SprA-related family